MIPRNYDQLPLDYALAGAVCAMFIAIPFVASLGQLNYGLLLGFAVIGYFAGQRLGKREKARRISADERIYNQGWSDGYEEGSRLGKKGDSGQ